jgi:hypothetical protein
VLRHGLALFIGALGVLCAWIAAAGTHKAGYAERAAVAMVMVSLAVVAAWGCAWAWRGAAAKRLAEGRDPGFVDEVLSEGPGEAVVAAVWRLLPQRVGLAVAGALFAAVAVGLVAYSAAVVVQGTDVDTVFGVDPDPVTGALDAWDDIVELFSAVVMPVLLVAGLIFALVTRELDAAVGVLILLGLYAVAYGLAYWIGGLDGPIDMAGRLFGWIGG